MKLFLGKFMLAESGFFGGYRSVVLSLDLVSLLGGNHFLTVEILDPFVRLAGNVHSDFRFLPLLERSFYKFASGASAGLCPLGSGRFALGVGLDYLGLEGMGVYTTQGYDPGVPAEKLEELRAFGASL